MEIFTVSLFGHREIEDLGRLENALMLIISDLMRTKPYVSFLIGRSGEFDEYAASIIKRVRKQHEVTSNEISLVLPYPVAGLEYYEKYYDSIIIPDVTSGVHPKSAITVKNHWMVEQADLVIVYVEREAGGAFKAMQYAKSLNKPIINLSASENALALSR